MKKFLIIAGVTVGIFFLVGGMILMRGIGVYNQIISAEEMVKAQWAQVQNVYQRRSDLIPNLVNTVEGYTSHEKNTLTEVAQARAQMGGVVKLDESLMRNPEAMERFQKAQTTFAGGLQRLMMVTERYPDLKASQQFQDLMVQLEGTENRISTERGRYNEAVMNFNVLIRKFPNSMIASILQVVPLVPFQAEEKAQTAPVVKFGSSKE